MKKSGKQNRNVSPRVAASADQAKGKVSRKGAKTQISESASLKAPHDFSPTLGELDLHLFGEGKHERIYEKLGAHVITHEGKRGVAFAVWAPNAKGVSVAGDFNGWDSEKNPMRSLGGSGIWELFIPGLKEGELYKYAIKTRRGEIFKA